MLLLSSDIELNPGPLSDKDEILQAIMKSSGELKSEIKGVKDDKAKIVADINNVKDTCEQLHKRVGDIDTKQTQFSNEIKVVKDDIENLYTEREMLQLDIDAMKDITDSKHDQIERMDGVLDTIENKVNRCK
ncbi:hypothetical protein ACF0H5_005210 [Mactra antiquata]